LSNNKSQWNDNYKQGLYNPVNPDKYIGNPLDIKYRSSWEYAFCKYLDLNERIIRWGCEQPIIMYKDLQNKTHRYYPDFVYSLMIDNNPLNYKTVIVEIKPASELIPPVRPLNETGKALENYEYAVRQHIRNKLKWESAVSYCEKNKAEFVIITEDRLIKEGLIPPKSSYKKKKY
jgi:hypothetical protein